MKNGGYGLAHIRKRHPDVNWDKIVDTINNGKKINAENQNGNPAKTAGSSSNSAYVLKLAQKALLSSKIGKNQKKLRFALKNGKNAARFATNTNLERRLIEKIWSHGR